MKEKFLIFIALFGLIAVLIGLNAATYVQQEKVPDSEIAPNRSTYNIGSTGTRAFYDLLYETGRNVRRWQEPPSALSRYDVNSPDTFVIIGKTQREFEESEIKDILTWVRGGGRLIIIDRGQEENASVSTNEFLKTGSKWKVTYEKGDEPNLMVDPANQKLMTESIVAAKPVQPTIYTADINAVQPSKYASSIGITWEFADVPTAKKQNVQSGPSSIITQSPARVDSSEEYDDEASQPLPTNTSKTTEAPAKKQHRRIPTGPGSGDDDSLSTPTPQLVEEKEQINAPVVHLAFEGKNILVEFPLGDGQIVLLTDPYIISNGGINQVDNAQIGINLVASHGGIIAFDEYHQGYGKNNNRLLAYFEGTPLVAFALQLFLLIGFVFYAQSRRFARPLPADEPNRLSKLEYVAAMAQLQQRTRAYDLAVENIYKDFRRRASRLVGVDNFTILRGDLAKLISARIERSADEIDNIMFKCEDIMHGEPTNKKEVIELISLVREIENELGLRRK